MTQDQRLQGRFEASDIQHAFQSRHTADVIGRAVGFHLPQKPHALLGVRQWHGLAAVDPVDGELGIALACRLNQRDVLSKGAQLAGVKQRAQGQFDITRLTNP